jgi:purine-binding chemotaxis protein CheW
MDYATFFIGDDLFGIPVFLVQEISRVPQIHPIPGHDKRIEGLINLRGRTSVVVNVERCIYKNLIDTSSPRRPKLLILETDDTLSEEAKKAGLSTFSETVILLVNDVYKIMQDERQEFHPPPAHVHEEYIEGVMKVNDELITLINIPRLMQSLLSNEGVSAYEQQLCNK